MENMNNTTATPAPLGSTSVRTSYPRHAIVFHTILLILGFLIVINNLAVIYLYRRRKELQHWTNYLLICLAMTDFLAGFLTIPFLVASSVFGLLKSKAVVVYFFANSLSDFVIISNVLTLFLIFTERYLSICRPIMSRNYLTFRKIRLFVFVIWVTAVLLAILPICWSYRAIAKLPATAKYTSTMKKLDTIHSLFISICCFILPSVLILYFTVAVMRTIFHVSAERAQKKKIADRRRAFFLLFVMFVLLLCAWSPLMTVRILTETKTRVEFTRTTLEAIVALRFITSFVNPLIHTLFKDDFKKALFRLLGTCRPSVNEEILLDDS